MHQRNGLLKGIQASRNGPKITHLFFADDSIFFANANGEEGEKLKLILQMYEPNFGQKINLDKSEVLFSPNTNIESKRKIQELFGVRRTKSLGRYLGIPASVGKDRKTVFRSLKEKMEARVRS